ncbi:hypothetical protein [Fictibacillus sp. KU28468]|uniref:hypothetical protein n=1 Tax=Fictibacillus sp. KU28468 TaxID=2991053 RepID=UPI00223CB3D0|nr:hypothetical protein [Fictibacillus sp. KU28468]UZJ79577.1 hypothetical protein OKX00_03590 [Fictibacillus sp. KU28468]
MDKNGNVIGTEELNGTDARLTFTASNSKDQDFFNAVAYSAGDASATIDFASDAVLKLVNSGSLKVTATVGGVTVDTLDVAYKNTDSVASKAVVNAANRTIDLSSLATGSTSVTVEELLFGKLNSTNNKYILNPVLTIQDQAGKTMGYDFAAGLDVLKNGLTVDAGTPVVTNLNNVSNSSGTLSLVDDSKSGSVTIVLPAVVTKDSSTTVNADLLAAPVSITVTLVK